ncbi:MAG TPA: hypothetical protein VLV50_11595 [Stellaceae bacterium]|nr:hypothetical protein [Stellaceae bacterium]
MDAADSSSPPETAKLHVSTLLVASERALSNALDELGFAQDDDRVIEHEGRLAFITCSHDPDCDDLYALISELAARGETWELQFRIDTGEDRAIFQRLARHQPVEAVDAALPPETAASAEDLPPHDLDTEAGRAKLKKTLGRIDPAEVFVTIGTNQGGRASAVVLRRNPRGALAVAVGSDEASLRGAIREILPTVMFSVAMKPPG